MDKCEAIVAGISCNEFGEKFCVVAANEGLGTTIKIRKALTEQSTEYLKKITGEQLGSAFERCAFKTKIIEIANQILLSRPN